MTLASVFVSHSAQDDQWCQCFVKGLQASGFDAWFDEQRLPGDAEWVATIARRIQACAMFLVVLTPEAWESEQVQHELQLAIAYQRPVIIVAHKGVTLQRSPQFSSWIDVAGQDCMLAAHSVAATLRATRSIPAAAATPAAPTLARAGAPAAEPQDPQVAPAVRSPVLESPIAPLGKRAPSIHSPHRRSPALVATIVVTLVILFAVPGFLGYRILTAAPHGLRAAPTATATPPLSQQVTMTQTNFAQHDITLARGGSVTLFDPADTGGVHILCLGQDQVCDVNASGPSELRGPGHVFSPGDTQTILFESAGSYEVTCTVHPGMNVRITVV